MPGLTATKVGVVAIGRNEGDRLMACLRSAVAAGPVVYVDSGSTDGSQDFARSIGVEVVQLAVPPNFTAARARNAGAAALFARNQALDYVQMVDGDCELQPGWIATAFAALESEPALALVFGRRRERHPSRSIYNALADAEWDVPVGEVGACGGDVLLRRSAFDSVGGYPETMIAGEEPDMSIRLRARGWRLQRIDHEMTLHDAAMTRLSQWWHRTRRGGHAFAELAHRHPANRWPNYGASCRRAILWGGVLPGVALLGLLLAVVARPAWLLLSLLAVAAFTLNIARIALRQNRAGRTPRFALAEGLFLMLGKIAEFLGLARFHLNRLSGRRSRLIEYKGPVVQ